MSHPGNDRVIDHQRDNMDSTELYLANHPELGALNFYATMDRMNKQNKEVPGSEAAIKACREARETLEKTLNRWRPDVQPNQ